MPEVTGSGFPWKSGTTEFMNLCGQARTLDQVGRAFGVTRDRIRQIENATLKTLASLPEAQRLNDCL
jgi:DNA-directed RNA polymerase sigma subunit (sigma70/sigma32)